MNNEARLAQITSRVLRDILGSNGIGEDSNDPDPLQVLLTHLDQPTPRGTGICRILTQVLC